MWLIAILALSQAEKLPDGVKRVPAARDAAAVALLDIGTLPAHVRPVTWYVWDNIGTKESTAALNFTCNAVLSQASTMIQPAIIHPADGPKLLRYNLEELCPRRVDFTRLWNELQKLADVEPYFTEPAAAPQIKQVRVTVPAYRASDGQWYDYEIKTITEHRRTQPAIASGGAGPLLLLRDLAGGNLLPMVRGDWLIATAWSGSDASGAKGRYYELAGIGKTEAEFLQGVGADPKLVANLRADQRVAQISGLTRKWRQIEAFFATGTRPEHGASLVTITHDINDADDGDPEKDAYENLLNFPDAAREIIAPKRNGLHVFWLGNAKGERQNEAPTTVVKFPVVGIGIDCIKCHGSNRGYNPVVNEVLETARAGFGPIGDLSSKAGASDTYDRLKGLYDGDLSLPLKQAGNSYAAAMDRATGGVFGVQSVEKCSAEVARIFDGYQAHLSAHRALREIGYEVDAKIRGLEFQRIVAQIVPPVVDEHPHIGRVRSGRESTRGNFSRIVFELGLRDVLRKRP